jgi:hypothetical protein
MTVVPSETAITCPVDEPWRIEFTVSGGFAGIEHKLEVESSGAYQAENVQSGAKVEGTLPADIVADLEELLPVLCQATSSGRPPTCADCFQYSLEVETGNAVYRASLNDISLPESPASPLVGALMQILNETLGP